MIDDKLWKYIYNAVFSIYLPPEDVIEKIILEKDNSKKEFKDTFELIAYLTLNGDKNVLQRDVKFILKENNDMYEENKKFYDYVVNTFKDIK
jgi:hypothetical protein